MTRVVAPQVPLRRCLAVWTVTTVAAGTLLGWVLPHLAASAPWAPGGARAPRFDTLLVLGCEAVAAVGTAWLWVLVTRVVLDLLTGRARRRRGRLPAAVRRMVLAACGLSLAAGLASPGHARSGDPHPADLLVGLSLPDRVTAAEPRGSTASFDRSSPARRPSTGPAPTTHEVTVRPGDTLWAIASRTLPPAAGPGEVERRWQAIYEANVGLIGADPHLIRPGQRLVLPGIPTGYREE